MSKPISDIELYNDLCAVEDALRRNGWCQGQVRDDQGRYCLMGAFTVATTDYQRWMKLQTALRETAGRFLTMFNDNPETTSEMVIGKIKEARDRLVG